jgi:hypothetical protein
MVAVGATADRGRRCRHLAVLGRRKRLRHRNRGDHARPHVPLTARVCGSPLGVLRSAALSTQAFGPPRGFRGAREEPVSRAFGSLLVEAGPETRPAVPLERVPWESDLRQDDPQCCPDGCFFSFVSLIGVVAGRGPPEPTQVPGRMEEFVNQVP